MTQRDRIFQKIRDNMPKIKALDVKRIAIFGSVARGEARKDSDVDVLVEFAGKPTFNRFMDLRFLLEDILGRNVDVLTKKGVRKELLSLIEKEAIDVA